MRKLFFDLVAYYSVWFACVLGAAHGHAWSGLLISIAITALQTYVHTQTQAAPLLWRFIGLMTVCGFIVDSLAVQLNWIALAANPLAFHCSAPWMVGLWLNFSFILYAYLRQHFLNYRLFAVLSLLGFPVAYYAGTALGAATLPHGLPGLLAIGVSWSFICPSVLYVFATRGLTNR